MLSKPLAFDCPSCGRLLKAESAAAGRRAFCPFCQAETMIPLLRLAEEDRAAALKALKEALGEPGTDKHDERRAFVRFRCEGVRALLEGAKPCRVLDLSRGGLALACDTLAHLPEVGGVVRLRLLTPYGPDLSLDALVVWKGKGRLTPAGEASVGGHEASAARAEVLVGLEFFGDEGRVGQELLKLERMLVNRAPDGKRDQKGR